MRYGHLSGPALAIFTLVGDNRSQPGNDPRSLTGQTGIGVTHRHTSALGFGGQAPTHTRAIVRRMPSGHRVGPWPNDRAD